MNAPKLDPSVAFYIKWIPPRPTQLLLWGIYVAFEIPSRELYRVCTVSFPFEEYEIIMHKHTPKSVSVKQLSKPRLVAV